jgi:putative toxin-antitoxin system antitoxin component (TIGR02293 family)
MAVVQKRSRNATSLAQAGHRDVRVGMPTSALISFEKRSGLSVESVNKVLMLTPRVRAKRIEQGQLTPSETERLVRLARIVELATQLFEGDSGQAVAWLESPATALSDDTPIDRATTEMGGRDVEQLIGRLDHGVYS